jgi:hypothetical protein
MNEEKLKLAFRKIKQDMQSLETKVQSVSEIKQDVTSFKMGLAEIDEIKNELAKILILKQDLSIMESRVERLAEKLQGLITKKK